ncbi:guanine nucleotide binding protein beta subunit [Nosema bombycis CQ1]|uniref:Guanine nucleotide binding protein beta subunit n=1 Tax=Nosema bombycis (strain CQ1 / CVCC 102059) TaxID=578461 RepID=R0MQ58_NOSB1|nr:guanine nucleotide binding protein beta subunit [Nosema bombycis CQ1]|eukprot:EOB15003.1 guanine nucleotide binding protein beta subunit [Nosema bombycis CQ1]
MDFSENGINFSVGSEEGDVLICDLRSKTNLNQIIHEGPIKKVKVRRKTTISCDRTSLQIFDNDQNTILNMNSRINTFEICDGVLFVGCDSAKLKTFYSSEFGEIPEWCKIVKVEE